MCNEIYDIAPYHLLYWCNSLDKARKALGVDSKKLIRKKNNHKWPKLPWASINSESVIPGFNRSQLWHFVELIESNTRMNFKQIWNHNANNNEFEMITKKNSEFKDYLEIFKD